MELCLLPIPLCTIVLSNSMNSQFDQSAGSVPPNGSKAEERKQQEQWSKHQQCVPSYMPHTSSQPTAPMSNIAENRTTTTRKRADSHQPPSSADQTHLRPSYEYDERTRRFSSADYGFRLSGNFNAPTEIELERERENRKSLKGVEKLRNKVKRLVGT